MPSLAKEMNLGPKSAAWLEAVGIRSLEDVRRQGVISVCLQVRAAGYPINATGAYAIYGAVHGMHWLAVPPEIKKQLREELAAGIKALRGKRNPDDRLLLAGRRRKRKR